MDISFDAAELLQLAEIDGVEEWLADVMAAVTGDLQIKSLKLDDLSFKSGNLIELTATVKTAAAGSVLLKLGSALNNMTGRKSVAFSLTASTEEQLHITLKRCGAGNLGPGNFILSLLINMILKAAAIFGSKAAAGAITFRDGGLDIRLDQLFETVRVRVKSIELQHNSCHISMTLTDIVPQCGEVSPG